MKISRHQIMALAAVGREKSFSAAAKTLALSQSSITQHISGLEKEIGVPLLIRNRAGAKLTQAGRDLYVLADKMRVLEEQFYERANQFADLSAGNLSVCVSTSLPAVSIISEFKKAYPGVKIDLQIAPWRDAIAMLHRRDIDVAIIMQPEPLDGLYAIEIEKRPFVAVLPRHHALASHAEISLAQLQQETLIRLGESSYTREGVDKMILESRIDWQNTLTVHSYEMMREAVIHGIGVSIALEEAQSPYQDICTVPLSDFRQAYPYTVVCTNDKVGLLTVRRFFDVATKWKNVMAPNYSGMP